MQAISEPLLRIYACWNVALTDTVKWKFLLSSIEWFEYGYIMHP